MPFDVWRETLGGSSGGIPPVLLYATTGLGFLLLVPKRSEKEQNSETARPQRAAAPAGSQQPMMFSHQPLLQLHSREVFYWPQGSGAELHWCVWPVSGGSPLTCRISDDCRRKVGQPEETSLTTRRKFLPSRELNPGPSVHKAAAPTTTPLCDPEKLLGNTSSRDMSRTFR